MHYLAAAVMAGIYIFNVPVVFAFIWKKHLFAAAFGVFDEGAALRRAERRLGTKRKRKKVKKQNIGGAAAEIVRLIRSGKFRLFSARLLIGAGDAAKTAQICGAATALGNGLRLLAERGQVDIRPDFSGRTLEGEVKAVAVFRAGDILGAAVRHVLMQ